MSQEAQVYLNGRVLPKSQVRIDPDDRGFLFGDGIYEVLRVRDGLPLFVDQHFARLGRSTGGCELAQPFDRPGFERMARDLIAANAVQNGLVYLQVTRGVASRNHAFPGAGTPPTVYAFAKEVNVDPALHRDGVSVIVQPDERWARVDMKTVNLLPNVLAAERAARAGAYEAILVRDGIVTEASHSNAWIVLRGVALTHPTGTHILAGVTRDTVLRSARRDGIACEERTFTEADMRAADEVFLTGTTTAVLPVVRVDGQPVGDGRPGPVARALGESYDRTVDEEVGRARAAAAL